VTDDDNAKPVLVFYAGLLDDETSSNGDTVFAGRNAFKRLSLAIREVDALIHRAFVGQFGR